MITGCLIFLASFSSGDISPSSDTMPRIKECMDMVPSTMVEHLPHYVEHFEEENLEIAVRVGWCESRGKETAYNSGADDSGLMQFIPRTWNWIAEKNDLPRWDEWIVLKYGQPYFGPFVKYEHEGFSMQKVQFVPHYNILMASLLAEDTYGKVTFRDWNASKFCWGNKYLYDKKWKREGY